MTRRRRTLARMLGLLAACVAAPPARAAEPVPIDLEAPLVTLRIADVDGDGIEDLVALDAQRRLRVWCGARGRGCAAGPTYAAHLADDVAYVALATHGPAPGYLEVGRQGATRRSWAGGDPLSLPGARRLPWTSGSGAVLADLATADGDLLLPTDTGWQLTRPGAAALDVPVRPGRRLAAAGTFVEDVTTATVAWAAPFVGRDAADKDARTVWVLERRALLAHGSDGSVRRWALPAPPPQGERRLLDLDGDGRPEVVERSGTNQEGHYALARPVGADGAARFESLGGFHLAGFQLEPEWVDLDGDGRLDVVITTIPIHGANILRTITASRVAAYHNAFLQRADARQPFATTPDRVLESEIEVQVRFTYAGTIEVDRALTLLVDVDVDGDGRRDLVRRDGPATLRLHRGTATGVWAPEGEAIAIPPMGASPNVLAYGGDLDGDGKDEIVLVYRAPPGGRERIVLLR
jgi:hypothetical protein